MARRFANLLSMRLAREWALAYDGALITDHDYLDRLLAMLGSGYADPAALIRVEQAQQGLNQLLGPESQCLPLTTLLSTRLPAMAMIHQLTASHPESNLILHPIRKSHLQ